MGSYKSGYKSPNMSYNYSTIIVTLLMIPLIETLNRRCPIAPQRSTASAETRASCAFRQGSCQELWDEGLGSRGFRVFEISASLNSELHIPLQPCLSPKSQGLMWSFRPRVRQAMTWGELGLHNYISVLEFRDSSYRDVLV